MKPTKNILINFVLLTAVFYATNCRQSNTTSDSKLSLQSQSEAVDTLTWKVGERGRDGRIASHSIEYFKNGVSLGSGYDGLAIFYNGLRKKNGGKIIIVCANNESPNFDPIGDLSIIDKLYPILRQNKIELNLVFNVSGDDIIVAPFNNPFDEK